MRKVLAVMCAIGIFMTVTGSTAGAATMTKPNRTDKTEMFYVVGAHPDDEFNSWGFIEEIPETTYTVFVTLTKGEGTNSCLAKEESNNEEKYTEKLAFVEGIEENFNEPKTGPYKYQGPGSIGDQEDHGEVHPLGNPWVGQSTEACKLARIGSWHWFLDAMHDLDGTGTDLEVGDGNDPYDDDDFVGQECGKLLRTSGEPICADVWADENGARIAFDMGNTLYTAAPGPDGDHFNDALFTLDDTIAALETIMEERKKWSLPELPETGMVSTSGHEGEDCDADKNPDHKLVQDALSTHDFDAGPQYGPLSCPEDTYGGGTAERHFLTPTTMVDMLWVDACPSTLQPAGDLVGHRCEERIGPFNKYYGWLFSTYLYDNPYDAFFKVFD